MLARAGGAVNVTLPFLDHTAYSEKSGDTSRWAVGLGRYGFERISKLLKVQLIPVRNRK